MYRRILNSTALILPFLGFFACDYLLYSRQYFTKIFGFGTQEGQVIGKSERAHALGPSADVIFFGSSYTRSGISSEPFIRKGILPLNYGVSGAGPVFFYHALLDLAPIIRDREKKPILFFEVKLDAFGIYPGTLWSELEQLSGIARDRGTLLADFPGLVSNFREYGVSSQFVSGIVVPSSIYRAYNRVVVETSFRALQGFFYGAEDVGGFAPLYSQWKKGHTTWPDSAPIEIASLRKGKVAYLKRALVLADQLNCPTVLLTCPSIRLTADEHLYDDLLSALPEATIPRRVLRPSEYILAPEDFDEGGHLNLWGSDRFAEDIIRLIGLKGHRPAGILTGTHEDNIQSIDIPTSSRWHVISDAIRINDNHDGATVCGDKQPPGELAEISIGGLIPEKQYVLELNVQRMPGAYFAVWGLKAGGRDPMLAESAVPEYPPTRDTTRLFLRFSAPSSRIRVSVLQKAAMDPTGNFRILRLSTIVANGRPVQ